MTRPARWTGPVILLHWAGAAAILALIVVGWAMIHGGLDAARTFDLYQQHKSIGFVALVLTAGRLVVRARAVAPPPPRSPAWEHRLAALVQGLLYLLTACAIFAGWILVSASPLPIPTRFFDLFVIPNIAPSNPSLFAAAVLVHKVAAYAIAALIVLHVTGALKHHFRDGDDTLRRMLPRLRSIS